MYVGFLDEYLTF